MPQFARELLHRRWLHAHEEDTETEMVFRPADYDFPPARGRTGFELRPDGTLAELAPGPTDRLEESAGAWELEGDDLVLRSGPGAGERQILRIASLDDDRLVVRR